MSQTTSDVQCSVCKFAFDNTFLLLTHLRNLDNDEFHQDADYVCPHCSIKLIGSVDFSDHLSSIHNLDIPLPNPNIHIYNTCLNLNPSTIKKTTNDVRPFKCISCMATFSRRYNLKQHALTHSRQLTPSTFQCSVCQKSFFSRSALKLHFRIHNNYTPFKCEYTGCSESFRTKKLMTTHMKRSHFGLSATNKRNYSAHEYQRLVRRIAELSSKTITEDLPLKKSANSAFSALPHKRLEPERQLQRPLGRASLDITQYASFYTTIPNCMTIQSSNTLIIPRRVGSANNFLVPMYTYRNNVNQQI